MTDAADHSARTTITIGDIEVTAFCDGLLPSKADVAIGIDADEAARLSGIGTHETLWMSVNEYVLKLGDRLALIDTGAGERMYPSLGRLMDSLRAGGVDPAAIDLIFLTHLHPDHMHGLIDAAGQPNFPNAEVILHEREANFWLDRDPVGHPRTDANMANAVRNLRPYGGRLRTVKDGETIAGVSAHPCFGHTPGHTAWIVASDGQAGVMWGDLIHLQKVQMAHPQVAVTYDLDPQQAAASRARLLDICASDGLRVLGAHLDFPGFYRVVRAGAGYDIEASP